MSPVEQSRPTPTIATKQHPEYTVCGRRITTRPEYYYPTAYQGRTIYFCTEFCLDAFQADPDRFYQAHSRSAQKVAAGDI